MDGKPKSTPELLLEAGLARCDAETAREVVEQLLDRTRQVAGNITDRIRELANPDRDDLEQAPESA